MQKLRFIIVGVWNTLIGYSIFYVMYSWLENVFDEQYKGYMVSIALSQILSVVQAFFAHKYVTFKSIMVGRQMLREFLKFVHAYTFTFIATIVMMPLVTELLYIKPEISALIVMLIVAIMSYTLNSKYVFNK